MLGKPAMARSPAAFASELGVILRASRAEAASGDEVSGAFATPIRDERRCACSITAEVAGWLRTAVVPNQRPAPLPNRAHGHVISELASAA
jgi:hypothetical protein